MDKVKELQHLSLATTYEVDNTFDSEKFIKMRLRVCHDGRNPNSSSFEVSDMENAKDSIKNIPILANVIFDEDGTPNFGGHDMEIEEDKCSEGQYRLVYKEVPIGIIPENCDYKIEVYNGKNYVFVTGYIWKGYSNYAQDIIERDKDIKISMEIIVNAYNYNAKEKVYNITDYKYQGITFLNKDFGTGMENALATTGTFSEDDTKEKFIIIMQELKDTLNNYNINNNKGGSKVDEKIIDLLNQYGVKVEDLDFDINSMSFEEAESKLKEIYDNREENNKEPEKFVKSFELSHSEIRYALYQLLSPVEAENSEWYFIDQVYDDRFEYESWEGTKIYRQYYKKDGDNVSFEGERIELFQERLTKEEKEALDKMRSNYSQLQADFETYKSQYSTPNEEVERLQNFEKDTISTQRKEQEETLFSQFDSQLQENEEYQSLKKKASNFSIEQLEKEVAFIVVKTGVNVKFSNKQNKKQTVKLEFNSNREDKQDNPYGDLFSRYLKKE